MITIFKFRLSVRLSVRPSVPVFFKIKRQSLPVASVGCPNGSMMTPVFILFSNILSHLRFWKVSMNGICLWQKQKYSCPIWKEGQLYFLFSIALRSKVQLGIKTNSHLTEGAYTIQDHFTAITKYFLKFMSLNNLDPTFYFLQVHDFNFPDMKYFCYFFLFKDI